jgi:hypothetical protein
MNIKRIAWESRGIDQRTIPADQRMAGVAPWKAPEATQADLVEQSFLPVRHDAVANSDASPTPAVGGQTRVSVLPDRATIAQVIEQVMATHGIARGSGAPKAVPATMELPSPSIVAAEMVGRLFDRPAKPKGSNSAALQNGTPVSSACSPEGERYSTSSKPEPPSKPAVEVSPFVSENDVRRAMTRSEKIFIGPKTILTPSARDLGREHQVFIETEAGSIR